MNLTDNGRFASRVRKRRGSPGMVTVSALASVINTLGSFGFSEKLFVLSIFEDHSEEMNEITRPFSCPLFSLTFIIIF